MSPLGVMASEGPFPEISKSSVGTSPKRSTQPSEETKEASPPPCSSNRESSNSTDVVLFQPEARLNPDVLELIFRHLNFKELLAAELVKVCS